MYVRESGKSQGNRLRVSNGSALYATCGGMVKSATGGKGNTVESFTVINSKTLKFHQQMY